jgi:hypothetical protein
MMRKFSFLTPISIIAVFLSLFQSNAVADLPTMVIIQEKNGCYQKVEASLQIFRNTQWIDFLPADGWARSSKCHESAPFQPYLAINTLLISTGTEIRWNIYAGGKYSIFTKPEKFNEIKPLNPLSCKKVGQKSIIGDKTFTCVKSGKKLIWNKGEVTKKQNSVNKDVNKISNETNKYPEAKAVQRIINTALNNDTSIAFAGVINYEGMTYEGIKVSTEIGMKNAVHFFSQLGFQTQPIKVFVTKTEPWLRQQVINYNCNRLDYLDSLGWYSPFACQDGSSYIVAKHWDSISLKGGLLGLDYQHILAHEYFHYIQQQHVLRNIDSVVPIWFWEGGAQFYSVMAYATWNQSKNYEDWLDYLTKEVWDTYLPCKTVKVQFIPNSGPWESRKCGYSKGAKSAEYLVAKHGSDSYKEILNNLSLSDFPSAFKKSTGQNLEDFYIELDDFLFRQGWN